MDYKIKKLPKSEVEIEIIISAEEIEKHRQKAGEEISAEVKIKGFREGHVPLSVLEKHVDPKYIDARAQELAIQRAYAEAVIKEKIQVVARPKVKIEKEDPLTFTAVVAVMPEVEIKGYEEVKVPKEEVKVTEKEVDEVIADLKKHSTTYKIAEREAKKGDRVEVDFEGFDEKGAAVPNTKSVSHPVVLGEGTLIPGFEEELVGLLKDAKKEFKITFPKDYHKKDFQNRKMNFKVEMKKIEEPDVPEFDEAFVEKVTGKKLKVEEFKKDIEKSIQSRKEEEAKQKRENEYVEKLIKKMDVEVPEGLIEEEIDYILEEMKEDISARGLQFEKFLEQAKTTEDDLRKKYHSEAEKRIKVRFALQYVIKKENIRVEDKDVADEIAKIKTFYPEDQHKKIDADFKKPDALGQLKNRLLLRKFFEKVLE